MEHWHKSVLCHPSSTRFSIFNNQYRNSDSKLSTPAERGDNFYMIGKKFNLFKGKQGRTQAVTITIYIYPNSDKIEDLKISRVTSSYNPILL